MQLLVALLVDCCCALNVIKNSTLESPVRLLNPSSEMGLQE